jgi:chromosome segregation ATPase
LVAATLLLACAFGCGRYTGGQHGYVASGKDWVIFLQFTEKEGRISGQVQAVGVEGGAFKHAEVRNPSFTGMRDGSNVSLNFAGFLTEHTITGTASGDTLSLVMPQPNGLLARVEFKRATVEEYNAGAEKLKRRIAEANEFRRKAQAAAARADEARRQAAEVAASLSRALESLNDRIADLDVTQRFEEALGRFDDHWREMREHEREFREKASARPLDTYKLNVAKYALDRLGFDRQHNGFDRQNLNYAIADANERLKKTREAVLALREAWQSVQSVRASDGEDHLRVDVTEDQVNAAVGRVAAEIGKAEVAIGKADSRATRVERQVAETYGRAEAEFRKLQPK